MQTVTELFNVEADDILRCNVFSTVSWLKHGFGTRKANPATDITLRQIHSGLVYNAVDLQDRASEGDALLTNVCSLGIGIRTADCVPILILDPQTRAVSAVHAGWRGSAAEIVTKTIAKMSQDFNTDPKQLMVAIGPCIRQCCYEVGSEVWRQFSNFFPKWSEHEGKRHLDLPGINARQLLAIGVPASQIFDCQLCTFCRADLFYSFRREPHDLGRMLSAIKRLS